MKATIRKSLFDHPFFDYAKRRNALLPEAAAESILQDGYPSFDEMVGSAKIRFANENVSWEIFEKHRNGYKKQRQNTSSGWLASRRRLAVAMLLLLLTLAFFTLVPAGRSLADSFFNMIMEIVGERIEFTYQGGKHADNSYENWEDGETRSYESIDAFVKETGSNPFSLKADWLRCKEVNATYSLSAGFTLQVLYETDTGGKVYVKQLWGEKNDLVAGTKGLTYKETTLAGGEKMYYAIDPLDGTFMGTAIIGNSIVYVGAERSVDGELLIEALTQKQ